MPAADIVLQNRYRVVRQLGKGGMGAVYEAFDERLTRTVALKETLVESDELKRAFEREARLLANLRHPVLPKVIDHFNEEDGQFLVMEFIPGSDLGELLLRRAQPFSPAEVLRWADDLLDALDYLHTHEPPIIHRDIKPANLKLTAQGKIILLDFGLAKGAAGQMTRTSSGMSVIGYTLNYAPLEQIQGERTSPRSDLYSLAATLYQLVTGRVPEDALKRAADLLNDDTDPLPDISQINPDVPVQLAKILMQALSLKPSLRPASAAEMRAALKETAQAAFAHVAPAGDDELTRISRVPGKIPIGIGGDQTMVLPTAEASPLAPNGGRAALRHPHEEEPTTWTRAKKWWLIGGGACLAVILIVGIYLLAIRSNTTVTPATPPNAFEGVPLPFRDSLPSVVSLSVRNADGTALRQASAFFFKADEIATSLSVIEGATGGRVTFVGQSGAYEVSGVTGIDRERGIVTLKVARARAPGLAIAGKKQTTMGERVAVLGSGTRTEAAYAAGLINGYLDDDRMEVGAQITPTVVGGPLLNAQGEVIGIIIDAAGGGRALAVPINYLADLIRSKPQVMTLAVAGAKDILFDWRKPELRLAPPAISKELEHKIIALVARAHREKAQPQASPGASPSEASPAQPQAQGADDDTSLPLWGEMSGATVTGVAEGSFTAAGVKQTAYLIDTNSGSPTDQGGPKYLAIFSGETLVADFPVPSLSLVLQTFDLNRDGINELLLGSHYTQKGEVVEWAKLVQVAQGRLRIIKDFETTYRSTCGSEAASEKVIAASAIFYPPAATGQLPDFRVDNFKAACPPEGSEVSSEQWKYTSTGKLQER
jgi:serine/threonine protein kinase/S1-C subfamily serine protease